MCIDRRDSSVDSKCFFDGISTRDLEVLIGEVLLDDDADHVFLSELLEVYDKREGVPDIDVDAAWSRFVCDHMGQGEIYLTDDPDGSDPDPAWAPTGDQAQDQAPTLNQTQDRDPDREVYGEDGTDAAGRGVYATMAHLQRRP